ncbi:hypothetical protein SASPL_115291 [Salvia splendens]|uniref:Uncharacterized protein n=2 Tax=Salvia splendens TaxID=180675 RepID=A0A8X8Y589_SALSN|nr:hypothetical protein SASPL_115291 [Salvia splendens]
MNSQHDAREFVKRHGLLGMEPNRRFLLHETGSSLPQPHLWYDNQDSISALKLFLDAGDELAEIPTYRL